MNVISSLIETTQRLPETPACITGAETLSYAQLLRRVERLRDILISAGIRPGMGLGLLAHNGSDFIIGLLAGLACEAVVMPLAPDLKDQEFSRALELVPMAAILHDRSIQTHQRYLESIELERMTLVIRPLEFHCKVASGVQRAAVIRFTSGTTGSSKGVVLSHKAVAARAEAAAAGLQIASGTRILWVLPMAYHFVVSILTYMRCGATVVLPESIEPAAIINAAYQHKAELLYGSPAILESLSSSLAETALPENLRVISTSTALSRDVLQRFERRFSTKICQLYGLIEVGLPIGNLDPTRYPADSVGIAMPGYEVAILDNQGRVLPPGQVGRLAVRGPGMFDAYLAPYRPINEVLVNGWFLTGDLATQAYDGSITVCGREKSVIYTGGDKVFPEEVEGVINSFPGVRASRVFGIAGPDLQEIMVAEVVPTFTSAGLQSVSADTISNNAFDTAALRAYLSERLSPHKVPRRFEVVSSIPMTQTGKVMRGSEPDNQAPVIM